MPRKDSPQRVARALLSVSDKRGLVEFAMGLHSLGIQLVASGGTSRALQDADLPVVDVAELTDSPEMLGGRVKTLHPKIHGGILARRDLESDQADLRANDIGPIDLVVVNLYPFEETVAKAGVTRAEAIEQIDIGGPSMIRSAAKNHAYVGVVTDPVDYASVLEEIRESGGLADATRRRLARRAFQRTAAYDTAIQGWLAANDPENAPETFPSQLLVSLPKAETLRYGENSTQEAALYGRFLEIAEPLHGKALSYNNLVDAQAALAMIVDFDTAASAAVGILKHNTPCGVGTGDDPLTAYRRAFETDPDSPFGGIIVSNQPFDLALAEEVDKIFTEVLIAPGFDGAALELLEKKKNRRLLAYDRSKIDVLENEIRGVYGGLLVQQRDCSVDELATARVVTKVEPTPDQLQALAFAWRVVKHVKSNAIVFAAPDRTLAVAGGATSRIDATHNAVAKAARVGLSLAGSALASDAFFPFADGLEAAVAAGAKSVIQPGGSNRDEEVIEAADRLGIPMIFTGVRHFRH